MLKLIKYELRKSRAVLGIMLAAILALESYFLISIRTSSDGNIGTSAILLVMASFIAGLVVFLVGVSSYNSELKQKTSYLLFLTPHSSLSIITAKLLFTMITAFVFIALLGGLCALDVPMLLNHYDELSGFYQTIDSLLLQYGVNLTQFYLLVGFNGLSVFLYLLSALVVAYMAITFSATVMQNRRGRGVVTVLVYALLLVGLQRLTTLYTDEGAIFERVDIMLRALVPGVIQSLCVIVVSLLGSAWMLERKVSL